MMHKSIILPICFCILFQWCSTVFAEKVKASEIMEKMEQNIRGSSSSGRLSMKIVTPGWQRQVKVDFWLDGDKNVLLKIVSPPREEGVATLRRGDVMWQYMPSVERTIKIPLSMIMQPWMGSDFTYEDMMKAATLVSDYKHKLAGTTEMQGEKLWKIESTPRPGVPVIWGRQVFLVGRDYLPRRQEFYDEKGRLKKTLKFSGFQTMGNRMFPSQWEMHDKNREGRFTVLKYERIQFNLQIKSDIFSLRSLRK